MTTILTAGIYDEVKGDPDSGLAPETCWTNIPDD
ncbi:MAG: rubredoxin [Methylobacter sp.]